MHILSPSVWHRGNPAATSFLSYMEREVFFLENNANAE
jgi:hypothetical protein